MSTWKSLPDANEAVQQLDLTIAAPDTAVAALSAANLALQVTESFPEVPINFDCEWAERKKESRMLFSFLAADLASRSECAN